MWAELLARIYEKELHVAARSEDKIPYTAKDGVFDDYTFEIDWWTNGFYAGLLWQLYGFRPDPLLSSRAAAIEQKLDAGFLHAAGMDHDSGFKWLLTANASRILTGASASQNRLLLAANDLAGRFNPAGGFLRAWNDGGDGSKAGVAIIDCMMNLPLLYLASTLTRDPRYREIAVRHATTAAKHFVREDGSCRHIAVFDPATGEFLREEGGQGMGVGSAWTRGQGWAIYGFTLSYLHTGREEFLAAAERVASFFLTHIPKTGLLPVDFLQPYGCDWEDDSAAAIAACGLLELKRATGNKRYADAAEELLTVLAKERCDLASSRDPLLTHCSAAYHDGQHNFALIYGDYFFVEAILKLLHKETFLW